MSDMKKAFERYAKKYRHPDIGWTVCGVDNHFYAGWKSALEYAGLDERVKCFICNGDKYHPEPVGLNVVCCRQPEPDGSCCGVGEAEPEWGPCQQCGGSGFVYNHPPAPAVPERWAGVVKELASDLEAEIESRRSGELNRRIERDLDVVRRARSMLNAAPETPRAEYSQGVAGDGAAILKDGQPMTIEEILSELRKQGE